MKFIESARAVGVARYAVARARLRAWMFSASIHKSCEHVTPLLQDDRMAISAQSHSEEARRRERVVPEQRQTERFFNQTSDTDAKFTFSHTATRL
jgi:hypothetical protein